MYAGAGQPWGMPVNPAAQQLNYPRIFVNPDPSAVNHFGGSSVDPFANPDPSAFNHFGGNSPSINSSPNMNNPGWQQQTESLEAHTQKLEDDLKEGGLKIKHHEDNVRYLKASKKRLDESVNEKQVYLQSYGSNTMEETAAHLRSEEKIIENILKHKNSAAALCLRFKKQAEVMSSNHSLTRDVLGVVATLGKVDNENLSRLLSKYLGLETMLAVVCKTNEAVKSLEAYNMEGLINKDIGLHAIAASIGTPLVDQFNVISLEDIRPYDGELVEADPQGRLALPKPRLPNGETPQGFLGYAVNMVNIDKSGLHYMSKTGQNLRETLFYHLFSNLQVYRSRVEMLKSCRYINSGAISLDGGIIRRPGAFTLGLNQQDVDVKFALCCEGVTSSLEYVEMVNDLKETKWKRDRTLGDLQVEERMLDHAKFTFEIKKKAFLQFSAERSMQMSQPQFYSQQYQQAGRRGPNS